MNTHHRETLEQIFRHPTSHNIEWRRVEHLFEALGADVTEGHHGRIKVKLNDQEASFHKPHKHNLEDSNEIAGLRRFLTAAGVAPG